MFLKGFLRGGYRMDSTIRILVIEDDPAILELLTFRLEQEGYHPITADTGRAGLQLFEDEQPDLIVLDLMLPEMDGLEVCRRIRKTSSVPIIMLTAKELEGDRVGGLRTGADDYVTKPFSVPELLARIEAVLRRARIRPENSQLRADDLLLDRKRRRVFVADQEIDLTPKEFDLLALLMIHRGEPIQRERLLEKIWGYEFAGGTRTLDVHVRRLRQKIGDDPHRPRFIETVHGVGYRFKEPEIRRA